jgi:hypothetical protein
VPRILSHGDLVVGREEMKLVFPVRFFLCAFSVPYSLSPVCNSLPLRNSFSLSIAGSSTLRSAA